MENMPTQFLFLRDPFTFTGTSRDYIARILSGITHRKILCTELKRQLQLPDYFRESWDVLFDCLPRLVGGDEIQRVVLLHEDFPLLLCQLGCC